jgi:hypothetical protein
MKIVYTGIESSGKSLQLARQAREIVDRNSKWFNVTGIYRPIRSNMRFSQEFENEALLKNVPIYYYKNLEEIIYETECDVFIDEILKYFDARNWANLSIDSKHWLTQGAKSGVHVYGSAQDFSQVEKSFRILCNQVFVITKLIGSRRPMKTSPPVNFVWGVCFMRAVNPKSFKGDSVNMETIGMPSLFLIREEDTKIFDTNAKVVPSDLPAKKKRRQKVLYMEGDTVIEEKYIWV